MKFGAMVVPRASDWRLFAELEQMGYDSAWVPDSQMIYSATYPVRALAAANTSRVRLGPGVADAQETAALRDFDPAYVSSGSIADRRAQADVRFSNRPFEVKHFQTIRRCSVDVAHGLVLLFGIGTRPSHHGIRG